MSQWISVVYNHWTGTSGLEWWTGIVESSIHPIRHFTNLKCDPKCMRTRMNVDCMVGVQYFCAIRMLLQARRIDAQGGAATPLP